MIAFRHFALRRGSRLLLSDIDLVIQSGWRLGVIGRNGCGKSSLFAALQGQVEPDAGDLDLPAKLRLASVAQETPMLPDPAIEYVLGGDEELADALRDEADAQARGDIEAMARAHHRIEELHGYDARARAGRLLHGLGFAPETHEVAVKEFSGGWRVRLNLARALMAPSELLLLDEPTNHLDLDAVLWLEEWLRRYQGTLLIISHDREFLDGVIDHTLHLDGGGAKLYSGNYSAFERLRAEQLRQQQIAHEREQAERAHLQSFIDRFKAKASKAKQAQSRMKRLEKMAGTEAVRAERAFHFQFAQPDRVPDSMLQLEEVAAGYQNHLPLPSGEKAGVRGQSSGEVQFEQALNGGFREAGPSSQPSPRREEGANVVLSDVRFRLEAGERIGLLGPNGAGKSTLVKTLVGELEPMAGERKTHKDLKIGYFAQHTVESLHAGSSPFNHLQDKAPGVAAQALRDFLGSWNFAGDRAFESVDGFSGGERARLALALIAWDKPNLLLLDEPTNHLDLDMREALADALAGFDGALVLVSHDRHLLGMVCDSFWRVADGVVEPFDGDLDDYARWLRSRGGKAKKKARAAEAGQDGSSAAASAPDVPVNAADKRRAAALQRENDKASRQRVKKVETRVAAIDAELVALEAKLADPAIYNGSTAELMKLSQQQGRLRGEKETQEAEWLELYESLEA